MKIEIPDHPKPEDMAESLFDLDEGLGMLKLLAKAFGPSSENYQRMQQVMRSVLPMVRYACAYGIAAERRRYAAHLTALSERAAKNGAPTRAKALSDLAAELSEATVWPEVRLS